MTYSIRVRDHEIVADDFAPLSERWLEFRDEYGIEPIDVGRLGLIIWAGEPGSRYEGAAIMYDGVVVDTDFREFLYDPYEDRGYVIALTTDPKYPVLVLFGSINECAANMKRIQEDESLWFVGAVDATPKRRMTIKRLSESLSVAVELDRTIQHNMEDFQVVAYLAAENPFQPCKTPDGAGLLYVPDAGFFLLGDTGDNCGGELIQSDNPTDATLALYECYINRIVLDAPPVSEKAYQHFVVDVAMIKQMAREAA